MYGSILRSAFLLVMPLLIVISNVPLVSADDVSGSDRLLCAALQATRCSAESDCQTGSPRDWNVPDFIEIDFVKKQLQTTQASGLNRVTAMSNPITNGGSIFIQGQQGGRAISIVIDQQSGDLTAAMASNGAAVSVFAVCTPLSSSNEN